MVRACVSMRVMLVFCCLIFLNVSSGVELNCCSRKSCASDRLISASSVSRPVRLNISGGCDDVLFFFFKDVDDAKSK